MSALADRIAEVLRAHPDVIEVGGWDEHPCCAQADDHAAHVAERIAELFTEETQHCNAFGQGDELLHGPSGGLEPTPQHDREAQ